MACTAAIGCGPVQATGDDLPVYRCGDTYSNQRCADAAPLAVTDTRSAAERAQGIDVARRDRRLADALRAERLARDAVPAPARPRATARAPACAASVTRPCPPPRPRHARAGEGAASAALKAKVPGSGRKAAH